jgi:hypothetical protein
VSLVAPEGHIDFLRDNLKSVRGVLMIRWSAHDHHILDLLHPALQGDIPFGIADPDHEGVRLRMLDARNGSQVRRLVTTRSFDDLIFDTDHYPETPLGAFLSQVK